MEKLDLDKVATEFEDISNDIDVFFNRDTGEFHMRIDEAFTGIDDEEDYEADCWIPAPTQFDINEYRIMAAFADSVTNPRDSDQLDYALHGKGAFRRFKDAIHRLGIPEDWYAFRRQAFIDIAQEWCEDNDLPYLPRNDQGTQTS